MAKIGEKIAKPLSKPLINKSFSIQRTRNNSSIKFNVFSGAQGAVITNTNGLVGIVKCEKTLGNENFIYIIDMNMIQNFLNDIDLLDSKSYINIIVD